MNLNEIKAAVRVEPREVEFKPAGKPTGWFFTLRHESSPEVETFMARYRAKLRDLSAKRKTTAVTNLISEQEDGLRIAHVAGWRWEKGDDAENGRPAFSRSGLKALLDDDLINYHVRKFIDEEVGSLDDFLEKPESA